MDPCGTAASRNSPRECDRSTAKRARLARATFSRAVEPIAVNAGSHEEQMHHRAPDVAVVAESLLDGIGRQ